ncbi:nidogen-like domain-containing protein [Spirulina sp. 06S082]|nr:nidogen-like domain-containing protein [Spirulina sp. 06S082]
MAAFLEKTGDLDFVEQSFTLNQGDSDKRLAGVLKAIDVSGLEKDRLFGSVVTVKEKVTFGNEETQTVETPYALYRWLDVVGGREAFEETGATVAFHEKLEDELGKFVKIKEVDFYLPESVSTTLQTSSEDFRIPEVLHGEGTVQWRFIPEFPVAKDSTQVETEIALGLSGVEGLEIGKLLTRGKPPKKVDLSENKLVGNDDDSSTAIPLGFDFDFYGQTYDSFYLNNNGTVTFGKPFSKFDSKGFPKDIPMIAPFWADVDTQDSGEVSVSQGVSDRGNSYIQVNWQDVSYFGSKDDKKNNFQLYLENDPEGDWIILGYDDMEWTSGLKSNGVNGLGGTGALIGSSSGTGSNIKSVSVPTTDVELSLLDNTSFFYDLRTDGDPELVAEVPYQTAIKPHLFNEDDIRSCIMDIRIHFQGAIDVIDNNRGIYDIYNSDELILELERIRDTAIADCYQRKNEPQNYFVLSSRELTERYADFYDREAVQKRVNIYQLDRVLNGDC